MNNTKQINEIEIFSEFLIQFNRINDNKEVINGWQKNEQPDFIYYLNDKKIGLELTELVFQEEKYKVKLNLTGVDYPDELKGYSILLFQKNDEIPSSTILKKIKKEVIEFFSEKGRLFYDEYYENKFINYKNLYNYVKKMNVLSGSHDSFKISLNNLITAKYVHDDFEGLVKTAIGKKIEKSKKYITDEVHLLLYTDSQTDVNDGPTFEIIHSFLSKLEIQCCKISRIYLFLRWKNLLYMFYF